MKNRGNTDWIQGFGCGLCKPRQEILLCESGIISGDREETERNECWTGKNVSKVAERSEMPVSAMNACWLEVGLGLQALCTGSLLWGLDDI